MAKMPKENRDQRISEAHFWLEQLKLHAEIGIERFSDLHKRLEIALQHQAQQYYTSQTERMNDPERVAFEIFSAEYGDLRSAYPQYVRSGLFLSVYSFIEFTLKETVSYTHLTLPTNREV